MIPKRSRRIRDGSMSDPDGSKMDPRWFPVLLSVGSVFYAGLEQVNAAAVGGLERFRSDAKVEGDSCLS